MGSMKRWVVGLFLGTFLLLPTGYASEASHQGLYLEGAHGPYRGRVIDAGTKQPIPGAVVVAVWRKHTVVKGIRTTVIHAAREVFTDSSGEFTMPFKEIERKAPPKTLRPAFFIFVPGYGAYPGFQVVPPPDEFRDGLFEGAGATVELPQLPTRQERGVHILNILADGPFERLLRGLGEKEAERILLDLGKGEAERVLPNLTGMLKQEAQIGLQLLEHIKEMQRRGVTPKLEEPQ